MSTNANIGYVENGKLTFIYLHWDGYPQWAGRRLLEHYNTLDKVKELCALGQLSHLDERLAPNPDEPHTFDKPADGVCVAYGRDRGEKNTEARTETFFAPNSLENTLNRVYRQEWGYVFVDGAWKYGHPKREFCPLTVAASA